MIESHFRNAVARDEDSPRVRSLVDLDRRDVNQSKSLSIDVLGDFKIFQTTTGVIADDASATVYLTANGSPTGEPFYSSKKPLITVGRDGNAQAGGFVRGHGPEKPGSSYCSRHRNDVWLDIDWMPNAEVWAVTVTNKSGTAADFVVSAQGV